MANIFTISSVESETGNFAIWQYLITGLNRLNNTLLVSVNNRDWISYTIESGKVGQFGRPAITAI